MHSPANSRDVERAEAVRIWLLGGLRVSVGSRTIEGSAWRLRKAAALVKLLSLSRGHHLHREQVMDTLWPEHGRRAASNNLRQALYAARRVLDPARRSRYLLSKDESLLLCPKSDLWVDVEAFEEAARAARRSRDAVAYRVALDLYTGDLLPEDRYEEWAETRREELRSLHLALLVELAGLYEEHGEYGAAVEALGRVVDEEPTNEEAHAGLIRLHALSGRPRQALSQYQRFRDALSERLDAEPGAATRRLRDEIASGRLQLIQPADLAVEEPPDPGKHNLPASRTSFVGREHEMLDAKRTLAMTRLLTFTGAGGSGKTRLALEVARNLLGVYPDGVWLVELAPLSEGELLPQAVAGTLGVREQPGQPITDTLAEALRDKETLLVLDNCEHLADPVARLLDALLDSCPRLRVLATSRETLNVEGEAVRWVSSLPVPAPNRLPTAGELIRYDAVRLFLDRVRLKLPDFDLTAENGRAVAKICRELEGIPLAIELATARVGTLSVEQISERLQDTLGLLSAGRRTAVTRQRTLRGALDWSYEMLGESERTLFERLSVFAGGWTLEAAEPTGAGDGIQEGEVLNLLSRLVNKSLVVTEASGDRGLRYRMLEPVRQYAREKLEESGEVEAVLCRHAKFFLTLAERTKPELKGVHQEEWLGRLEQEHDNHRAALSWALERRKAGLALRLSAALGEFWYMRGHLSEGRRWLERGLAGDGMLPVRARAKALNEAGYMALYQGELEPAIALLDESVGLFTELGAEPWVATSLMNLGHALLHQGDNERLKALCKEAEGLRSQFVDQEAIAMLLLFLGMVTLHEGNYERTVALLDESLALFRKLGDTRRMTMCHSYLWMATLAQGNQERAAALLKENLHLLRRLGLKPQIFYGLLESAVMAAVREQPARAARLWGAAEALREVIGLALPLWDHAPTGYEGQLAAVRAQLGNGASWEAAWQEGRTIGMEEAIEYALSAEEEPVSPTPATAPEEPKVAEPPPVLTHREEEVATLVAQGLTNRRAASELSISEHTVATHVAKILKKLGLHSRSQLAAWVTERGLHPSDLR